MTTESTWEMTDEELAQYLGVDVEFVDAMPPGIKASYTHIAWVEQELRHGRKPNNVLVCEE